MLQFIVLAVAHPRRPPRSGNVQTCRHSNVSTSLRPNSHGINIFANPHPLTPVASIFYKNIGGKGASAFQSPICPPNPFKMNTCKSVSKQSTLTPFRINTYEKQGKRALFAQFWCNVSPFRINTCKSVSKQRTLTTFRMNTYEKQGEGGTLVAVSSHPVLRKSKTIPEERRCRVPHARSGEHAIFLLFLDCKPHPLGVGSSQPYPFPTQLPLPNSLEA